MERFKNVSKASIIATLANFGLLIIKSIVAFITGSRAMIADSINSFGDILSSIITFIGNKIASKEADFDHNLGHGKAEYIYSMLISVLIIFISVITIKDSIIDIFIPSKKIFSIWLIITCIVTIITKFILYIYTSRLYKKCNNLLIKASSKDHLNDMLITFVNLLSIIAYLYNIKFIDNLFGIFISIFIIISISKIFIESYNVLMDKSIDVNTKNEVLEIVHNYKDIKKVIHFNSTPVGYRYQISFTIFVDGNMKTIDSHKIADNLEKEIVSKLDDIYLCVIHVNPI